MAAISSTSEYDPRKWKDKGIYWLYDTDQKDPDWLLVRKGRPSGSNCGYLLGHGNPQFGSVEDTILEITGKKEKIFTPQQRENMDYGNEVEPLARAWYEKRFQVKVTELGFVVPKWDYQIGVSVDGVMEGDGMIEIKGPKRMYQPLNNIVSSQKNDNYDHVWTTHYDQVQLGMSILQKKWCDYVVFCVPENKVFVQRIPFDFNYWLEKMYRPLKIIMEEKIRPLLQNTPYPLMPPS